MPAAPRSACPTARSSYKGDAEDRASIFSLDEQAEVPAGHYRNVLMTRTSTR